MRIHFKDGKHIDALSVSVEPCSQLLVTLKEPDELGDGMLVWLGAVSWIDSADE